MNKELAKTLTLALVNYIDENRPEGTMDCSNGECMSLEKAFTEENFNSVETLIKKKLSGLTEFEQTFIERVFHQKPEDLDEENKEIFREDARFVLDLAMADLERTYFSNPDKLPKWLKDDIARKELNAHTKGYNKGYEVATKLYDESVAYHFPNPPAINIPTWTPPCYNGGPCTNPQMDCINCPRKTTGEGFNTSSGTSTATLQGNTSVTDGKEHNPSFTD